MRLAIIAAIAALASSCIQQARADTPHGKTTFTCTSGITTSTALTECQAAPTGSVALRITDIIMSASVAATTNPNEQLLLKYGTGTNCGAGTTTLLGMFNPAVGGLSHHFDPAISVPAANAVCWMDAAVGSKSFVVSGWYQ